MLGPVELSLFPSCYDCLSWSADGEIAIAAGEFVQILTPKTTAESEESASASGATNNWHISRFRANVFTNAEWPLIVAQSREYFALGPEQSLSNVVSLAWSPPGLGKYRRCVLAVLTSNLLLSLYENTGQGKWTRVAVVNDSLSNHFKQFSLDEGPKLRKSSIRSFSWCPPFKIPAEETTTSYSMPGAESRWGIFFLSIVTDDNDVLFLRARRSASPGSSDSYSLEILSLTSLHDVAGNYPSLQPSVFSASLKAGIRSSHLSCGPWFYRENSKEAGNTCSATANVAVVYGMKVKVVRLDISLTPAVDEHSPQIQHTSTADSHENTLMYNKDMDTYHFQGPLQWLHKEGSSEISLAAGTLSGMALIFSSGAYDGSSTKAHVKVQGWPYREDTADDMVDEPQLHWEPTSAMTAVSDGDQATPTLHLGTVGGYTASADISQLQTESSLAISPFKHQLDNVRDQFDIDRDLGGLTVARVWGLASYRGLAVAAVTVHPGDTIEYRTSMEERTTLLFAKANNQANGTDNLGLQPTTPDLSSEYLRGKGEALLGHVLFAKDGDYDKQSWCQKVLYTVACCAIVESHENLLPQAQEALEWLAKTSGADLTEEINKCSAPGGTINAKSAEQLSGPGQEIFEKCDVCDAGVSWYSAQEAQCAAGHLFVRCGLTLLSIQDPGVSKFCSLCGTEFLSEDLIDSSHGPELQQTTRILSDVFDTCIYCNGKFRA